MVAHFTHNPPKEDLPFEFVTLPTNIIMTDKAYQRSLSQNKVDYLAYNFDIALFGAIKVGQRSDGRYYVWDGQHRLAAARKRGIAQVPCLVYGESDVKTEANNFVVTNSKRSNATATARFKASLASGDPIALAIREICRECGFEVDLHDSGHAPAHHIRAVTHLDLVYRSYHGPGSRPTPNRLRKTLRLIGKTWPDQDGNTSSHMLAAVDLFLRKYHRLMDEQRFCEKLAPHNPRLLSNQAGQLVRLTGGGNIKCLGLKLWEAYNKGLGKAGRLPSWDDAPAAPLDVFEDSPVPPRAHGVAAKATLKNQFRDWLAKEGRGAEGEG